MQSVNIVNSAWKHFTAVIISCLP